MLHFSLDNFTHKQREAVAAATKITNQIKALLDSKEVVTLGKLTGTEHLADDGKKILQQFIDLANSPLVTNSAMLIDNTLGGLGANLSGFIHDGCPILHGITDWIKNFEAIYHLNKKKALG